MRTRTKLPRQGNMAGRNHPYTTGMVSTVGGTMIGRSPMHCGCLWINLSRSAMGASSHCSRLSRFWINLSRSAMGASSHCSRLSRFSGMLSSSFRRVEPYAPLLSTYGAFGRHYTDGNGMHGFTDVIMGTRTERTMRTERMDSPERASQYSVGFHPTNTMRSTMAESHSQHIGLCPISTDKHFADGNGMHGWFGRRMTIGVWGMR